MTPPRYWPIVQRWWIAYNPTRREQYGIIAALTLIAASIALLIIAALYGQLHF